MGSVSDFIKVRVHKDFREREYVCTICLQTFHTRNGARQHVKKKHRDVLSRYER